jgi:hypothetical protein
LSRFEGPYRCAAFGPTADTTVYLAVVAIDEVPEQLVDGLEREKLAVDIFADVDTLLETSNGREPLLVLLAHDEAVPGLLRPIAHAQVILAYSQVECWNVRATLMAGAGIVLLADLSTALGPCPARREDELLRCSTNEVASRLR